MRTARTIAAAIGAIALLSACAPMIYVDSATETSVAVCYNHYHARRQQAVNVAVQHCRARGLIARETGRNAFCETGGSWRELTFECAEAPQRSLPRPQG
jgi:hypothetical protein